MLADAFAADRVYAHLIPDEEGRRRVLPRFLSIPAADAARLRASEVAVEGDRVLGAALWLPPGAFPMSARRRLRALPRVLATAATHPAAMRPLSRLGAAIEAVFPAEPVWYLEVLGVAAEAQGGGIGGALLAPGLARADRDGVACYLETSKEINVRFYERHGFRVEREDLDLAAGGPRFWLMRRPPGG